MKEDFKGIFIPKELFFNKELSWSEKILLVEIQNLDDGEGCKVQNKYFVDFLRVSRRRVTEMISKLKKLGYIEEINFDGRIRTLKVINK